MKIAFLLLPLSLGLPPSVMAGTKVLGVEIGVTTPGMLRKALDGHVRLEDRGVNKWSGGDMLRSGGAHFDVDGLQQVDFIFDPKGLLCAVLMAMDKDSFDDVYQAVSLKYTLQREQRPFVGDRFARFATGDGIVELDAPHLSFELSVRYLRRDLDEEYQRRSRAEVEEKRKTQAAKF